jgi:DNA-binding MarR family transcriptional regulator
MELKELERLMRYIRKKAHHLTCMNMEVFFVIAQASDGITQREISRRTGINSPTLSRVIGTLSKYGRRAESLHWVEIRESEEDRRFKKIFLTEKGREVVEDILREVF